MLSLVQVLACCFCAHDACEAPQKSKIRGRFRVDSQELEHLQPRASAAVDQLRGLVRLLSAVNPASGWNVAGAEKGLGHTKMFFTGKSDGSVRGLIQQRDESIDDLSSEDQSRIATLQWINDLVIGNALCPWAQRASRGPYFRLYVADDLADMERMAVQAASVLSNRDGVLATTLFVLDANSGAYPGFVDFSRFCTRMHKRIQSRVPSVGLIFFHPETLDIGPDCPPDPYHTDHYSSRSPLPVLQLLRQEDLSNGRKERPELLSQNRQRLQALGRKELYHMLHAWRKLAGIDEFIDYDLVMEQEVKRLRGEA